MSKLAPEQLSEHFKSREFACHCGCGYGLNEGDVSAELVKELEAIRVDLGKPITIMSGCRCVKHNKAVGGATHSQHVLGTASDIKVAGMEPREVQEYLMKRYPNDHGIGRYNSFTHFDVRGNKARWDMRK